MNKVLLLVRKELKDVLTLQSIIPLVLIAAMFIFMGQIFADLGAPTELTVTETDDSGAVVTRSYSDIIIYVDEDQTEISRQLREIIEQNGIGTVSPADAEPAKAFEEFANYKDDSGKKHSPQAMIVIPSGFSSAIEARGDSADIKIYSQVKSLSLMENMSGLSVDGIIGVISSSMSDNLIAGFITEDIDINFIKNPIVSEQYTLMNGVTEKIGTSEVIGFITTQTIFLPIILFIVVMYATQMLATSISTEKTDKTLETLLTTPLSRTNIIVAKMISAAIMSLVYSVIYMFSLSFYTKGMSGGGVESSSALTQALANMGVSFDIKLYAIIGIQLFLSILIGLSIALIIGALAEDMKNLQSLMMPMMIVIMLPYLISMFMDINTLPLIGRIPMYIVPFTHTFTAINNVFTGNYVVLIAGMIYQLVFLIVTVRLAVWIFSTDKLFTLKLARGKGSKLFRARLKG